MLRGEGAAGALRAGLLLLVALGLAGTALALAYDRHWQSPWQLAPWITLGIIGVAGVALVVRQTASTVWLARTVAVLAIVIAILGVWRHIDANYNADTAAGHHHVADPETTTPDARDPDDAEETPASSGHDDDDHHHDDDQETTDDAEETTTSSGHHGDDQETTASAPTGPDSPEMTSTDASLVDAMTGAVGHAPVPAALAIVLVGLALALATIGLGSKRSPSQE